VPMLFITGDADLYAPPPVLRLFTARIKNSGSLIVPEAGHSTYWEQPEVFNRTVLEFIRKQAWIQVALTQREPRLRPS